MLQINLKALFGHEPNRAFRLLSKENVHMNQYQSENITELAKVLLDVQRTIQPAIKDAENPFTKSWYASLNSVMFRLVATANTNGGGDDTGLYQGTQRQNLAWLDRFTICEVGYPAADVEKSLLARRFPSLPESLCATMQPLCQQKINCKPFRPALPCVLAFRAFCRRKRKDVAASGAEGLCTLIRYIVCRLAMLVFSKKSLCNWASIRLSMGRDK